MNIKKGDKVKVISGKDKGKSGAVLRAFPKLSKVLREGVNKRKIHKKARKQGEKGKTVEMDMPVHVSNVSKVK